jgi:hypothetical protein
MIGTARNFIESCHGGDYSVDDPEGSDDAGSVRKEKQCKLSRGGFARWTNPDGSYIKLVL